ncbi:stage V sporulation protein AA [Anaerosporobacter sp.]|uniref:stage V sporulation protein AA n=1 Tax=Anaerosporobacter sp. TaxID=1872529 RepID=UPI00286F0CF6|nr:stage V sporulation protein AA [Anaerosporobacter sp.]
MMQKTVYIKIPLRVIVKSKQIMLKDIAVIYCADEELQRELECLILLTIEQEKNAQYAVSIMKIIVVITSAEPSVRVINLGEEDFLVEYKQKAEEKIALEYMKAAFVAAIMFFGAAFSIMTFNTDVSVQDVFDNVYTFLMDESGKGQGIIEISYAIGLPIGILVFFNHFSSRKVMKDPTPIQIEMRKYEKDVENAILSNASREGKTIDID